MDENRIERISKIVVIALGILIASVVYMALGQATVEAGEDIAPWWQSLLAQTPDPNMGSTPAPPSGGETSAETATIGLTNLGLVMVTTSQPQPLYASPGGQIVRDAEANEIWLPNDADNNGFDTYTVTSISSVDGEVWVGIFTGADVPAWLPLDGVALLSQINSLNLLE